mmetsp:Transcript_15151/g.22930  ORF Transcript_15151/g.22930 Transcript_15151/m.22930 type:complete len:204 (+) Transcript_15151:45-656(+)
MISEPPAVQDFSPEKPPKFSFEKQLDIHVQRMSGASQQVPLDDATDHLDITPIGTRQERKRTWSFLSDNGFPSGNQMIEDRVSIPKHLRESGGSQNRNSTLMQLEQLEEKEIQKKSQDPQITPALMAQMKKLESLQKPFSRDSENNYLRTSLDSDASNVRQQRGDSALFDEKQLEYVRQCQKANSLKSSRNPTKKNEEECCIQ